MGRRELIVGSLFIVRGRPGSRTKKGVITSKVAEIMNRRSFGSMAVAGAMAMLTGPCRVNAVTSQASTPATPASSDDLKTRWQKLDDAVRGWWDSDLHRADADAIRNDP